jgi:hypothetical protein
MGGFTSWVEGIADSKDGKDYLRKFSDAESASMWQSLSYGANYKAAYCMAVCPAGEDVIGPSRERKQYLDDVVKPFEERRDGLRRSGLGCGSAHAKEISNKTTKAVSNDSPNHN